MLSGDNGLLTKSTQAATDNAIAAVKDEISLAEQKAMSDYLEDHYSTSTTKKEPDAFFLKEFNTLVGNSTDTAFSDKSFKECTVTVSKDTSDVKIKIVKDNRQVEGTIKITGSTGVKDCVLTWQPITDKAGA